MLVCDPDTLRHQPHFLATILGKKKRSKIQSTSDWGSNGDKTNPHKQDVIHPDFIDELPKELKQQVETKFNTILKAFLESCTKDRWDKVTRYKEPDFSEFIALHHRARCTRGRSYKKGKSLL
jgi:hypothetical protein